MPKWNNSTKLLKSISNPTFSLTLWIGNNSFRHSTFPTTPGYHSTIATTPFELLFGVKPRLPSFPNPDIERVHYGEDFASERLNILRKARLLAHQHAQRTGQMTKDNFDKNTKAHSLKIGDSVLIKEMNFQGKNAKLAPKWIGPAKITDVNDTNARIKTAKGKKSHLCGTV